MKEGADDILSSTRASDVTLNSKHNLINVQNLNYRKVLGGCGQRSKPLNKSAIQINRLTKTRVGKVLNIVSLISELPV